MLSWDWIRFVPVDAAVPGLVYRLKKPKTATLIFNSGKMVCTGATSEKLARKAVMKVVDELKRGSIVILAEPEIQIQKS